jgi:putative peptidoglycan lipid II flippase
MPAWAEGEMLVRLLRLGALVFAGLIAYFGMLLVLGFRLRDFARRSL